VQNPDAVGRLLLGGLNPAAAQLLTQVLEAADSLFDGNSSIPPAAAAGVGAGSALRLATPRQQQQQQQQEEEGDVPAGVGFARQEFYGRLYGTVSDPSEVLQVLLQHKTMLAAAATDMILKAQLGRS
jgi:hypothetical protein